MAKDAFDRTMGRAFKQINLYKILKKVRFGNKSKKRIAEEDLSELVRAALVLGVSAFDAYFTNKFVKKLVPFLKQHGPTDGIVELFDKAKFDTRAALELIPRDSSERPYRKLRTFIDNYLEGHVTQRLKTIDELFLAMGLKNLSKNAQKKARRNNLLRRIELAVERRHCVVHAGDLNSHGKLRKIDCEDVRKRLKDMVLFVENCDEIINSRIR